MQNLQNVVIKDVCFDFYDAPARYDDSCSFLITATTQHGSVEYGHEVMCVVEGYNTISFYENGNGLEGGNFTDYNHSLVFKLNIEESKVHTLDGELDSQLAPQLDCDVAYEIIELCREGMIEQMVELKLEQEVSYLEDY